MNLKKIVCSFLILASLRVFAAAAPEALKNDTKLDLELFTAVRNRSLKEIEALIEKGANVNLLITKQMIDSLQIDGDISELDGMSLLSFAFILASSRSYLFSDTINLLIKSGAKMVGKEAINTLSVVNETEFDRAMAALYLLDFSLLEKFIDKGNENYILNEGSFLARAKQNGFDCDNYNILMLLLSISDTYPQSIEIAYRLIKRGANVNHMAKNGSTPLHFAAACREKIDLIKLMIEHKGAINVKAKEKNNDTPLHVAAESGNSDTVKELIKCGALLNEKNELDQTPLHKAAQQNMKDSFKVLVEAGADYNAQDFMNLKPSERSVENKADFDQVIKDVLDSEQDALTAKQASPDLDRLLPKVLTNLIVDYVGHISPCLGEACKSEDGPNLFIKK